MLVKGRNWLKGVAGFKGLWTPKYNFKFREFRVWVPFPFFPFFQFNPFFLKGWLGAKIFFSFSFLLNVSIFFPPPFFFFPPGKRRGWDFYRRGRGVSHTPFGVPHFPRRNSFWAGFLRRSSPNLGAGIITFSPFWGFGGHFWGPCWAPFLFRV